MNKHVRFTLPNGQIIDTKRNPRYIYEKPLRQAPPPLQYVSNPYYEEYDYVDFNDPLIPVYTYEPKFPPPPICKYEPIQTRSLYKYEPRHVEYDDIYEQPQFDLF